MMRQLLLFPEETAFQTGDRVALKYNAQFTPEGYLMTVPAGAKGTVTSVFPDGLAMVMFDNYSTIYWCSPEMLRSLQ